MIKQFKYYVKIYFKRYKDLISKQILKSKFVNKE